MLGHRLGLAHDSKSQFARLRIGVPSYPPHTQSAPMTSITSLCLGRNRFGFTLPQKSNFQSDYSKGGMLLDPLILSLWSAFEKIGSVAGAHHPLYCELTTRQAPQSLAGNIAHSFPNYYCLERLVVLAEVLDLVFG